MSLATLAVCTGSTFAASPSPDGEQIAFSFIGGPENIYVANAGGSAARPVVERETSPVPARGGFTDPRDSQSYPTVEIDGMVWMARNLNYAGRESYCYENEPENCERHGRLYRWEAALAACPPGWHLSTEFEWQAMELAIGLPFEELEYRSNRGTIEGGRLKLGGDLGFDVQYAGWRGYETRPDRGRFRSQGEAAALWTSTEADLNHAWHRDIDTDDEMIWRSRVVKPYALSIRCVQNRSEYDVSESNP